MDAKDFTPWDFVKLVKELNEHEAELKSKVAKSGVASERGEAAESRF